MILIQQVNAEFSSHVLLPLNSVGIMSDWAIRLERKRKERGWSKAELARRADVDRLLLYRYLAGEVDNPRGDNLKKLARAVGVEEIWLRHGAGAESLEIPVVGYTAAGESWMLFDGEAPDPHETVSLSVSGADPIAIEVRGSSNSPVYRDGDRLICSRLSGIDLDRVIGKDCVICTDTGERLLKQVHRGNTPHTFRLRSYNPDYGDRDNVRLAWAAPVVWIRRG